MELQTQLSLPIEREKVAPRRHVVVLSGKRFVVSDAFDTYWRFAAERQSIFFRRLEGIHPWTSDPILRNYKFTNAYRASDRVSQYLIRNVIYDRQRSAKDTFFRIMLFKLFNKIETWELLQNNVGEISTSTFDFRSYDRMLTKAIDSGTRIYSAAYIMPSGGPKGESRKHRMHLLMLQQMLSDQLHEKISDAKTMADAFGLLRAYKTIGDFLAYQFITDLNYSEICDFKETEFVMPGPGARDGVRKCFPEIDMKSAAEVTRIMCEIQEQQFERLGVRFASLWGRRLQLIDCQNLFCEVDKYSRVAHPEIEGLSGRTRIKQSYRPVIGTITPFYPPKWSLNLSVPLQSSLEWQKDQSLRHRDI